MLIATESRIISTMLHYLEHAPPQTGLDGAFACYETLDALPHQSHALTLLRRCSYIVGPVMRRHGWAVPILSELGPSSSCYGKSHIKYKYTRNRHGNTSTTIVPMKVELRLRDHRDPSRFVHTYSLIRTMLHELAHFEYRNHFFEFYKFNAVLLSELVKDVGRGELKQSVRFREIPQDIADLEEIMGTMIGDLRKSAAEIFRPEKKDNKRRF
jgi:hypothetical protein